VAQALLDLGNATLMEVGRYLTASVARGDKRYGSAPFTLDRVSGRPGLRGSAR